MAEITKERVDALNQRIKQLNEKRVEYRTKKQAADKQLEELSKELGIDLVGKSVDELKQIAADLEKKEKEKFEEIEKQVNEAEELLKQ